jgi:hypothetical protein
MGFTIDQFFTVFSLAENRVSDWKNFVWYYDPNYGNCFKFNSGQTQSGSAISLVSQTHGGFGNGIRSTSFLDVSTQQAYSFMTLNQVTTFGLKISIDDQNTIPLYYSKMITMQPGTCTYIKLKKTITKNLPKPYSSCQDLKNYHSVLYDKFVRLNKTYSQQTCYALCNQKKVLDSCGCALNYFPNVDNNSTCSTLAMIYCALNLTLDSSGCDEYCPLECESITFDFTTTFEIYPDQSNLLVEQADPVVVAQFQSKGLDVTTSTFDLLSESIACVYVFYDTLETTIIEESEAFLLVKLISVIIHLK